MDQKKFMEDCLHVHEDLLKVEQQLHEWISAMAGFEPIDAKPRKSPSVRAPAHAPLQGGAS